MRVPPSTRPIHIFLYIIALLAHPSLGYCLHIPPSLRSIVNETFTLGGVRAKQVNTLNWMDWSSVMMSLPSHKILLLSFPFPSHFLLFNLGYLSKISEAGYLMNSWLTLQTKTDGKTISCNRSTKLISCSD